MLAVEHECPELLCIFLGVKKVKLLASFETSHVEVRSEISF